MARMVSIHPLANTKYAARSITDEQRGCSAVEPPDWLIFTPEIDAQTDRPRTPNQQYTELTEQQIQNIETDPSPFFHQPNDIGTVSSGAPSLGKDGTSRFSMNRYATTSSKHLFRGTDMLSHDFGYITDDAHSNHARAPYDVCDKDARVRWPGVQAAQCWYGGADTSGVLTKRHQYGEHREKFTTIDMYRRPNTTAPGTITMKFGRPSKDYYQQRMPQADTWFGANIVLNKASVGNMPPPNPNSGAGYAAMKESRRANTILADQTWPYVSETTLKYCANEKLQPELKTTQEKEAYSRNEKVRLCNESRIPVTLN